MRQIYQKINFKNGFLEASNDVLESKGIAMSLHQSILNTREQAREWLDSFKVGQSVIEKYFSAQDIKFKIETPDSIKNKKIYYISTGKMLLPDFKISTEKSPDDVCDVFFLESLTFFDLFLIKKNAETVGLGEIIRISKKDVAEEWITVRETFKPCEMSFDVLEEISVGAEIIDHDGKPIINNFLTMYYVLEFNHDFLNILKIGMRKIKMLDENITKNYLVYSNFVVIAQKQLDQLYKKL